MKRVLAACGRDRRVRGDRAGATISDPAGDADRAVAAGRLDRHRHARACARDREAPRAVDRDREPAGRGRHARSRQHGGDRARRTATRSRSFRSRCSACRTSRRRTSIPAKDFTYIIHLTGYTFGVVVKRDAPWKTFNELLDYAKANPGKINYGTPGAGTSLHITMEQIAKQKGIKWTQVPFKGQADSMNCAARRTHRCRGRTRPAGPGA